MPPFIGEELSNLNEFRCLIKLTGGTPRLRVSRGAWWNHCCDATVLFRCRTPGGSPLGERSRPRLGSAFDRCRIGIRCIRIANLASQDGGCQRVRGSGFALCAEYRAGRYRGAGHDVTASVSDNSKLKFGLATFPSSTQTYPAISTNGGTTWKVDGPLFHVDALQGATVVASSGVLPPHSAYFWGRGGNLIWITYDEGAHWWTAVFGAGVDDLSSRHGTLEAVVFGAQVRSTALQRFLYVSTDSGKTWRVRRQLADLHT